MDDLTIDQAAEILGVGKKRMYQLRQEGKGPVSYRRGRELRYRREDLDKYLDWEREYTSRGQGR